MNSLDKGKQSEDIVAQYLSEKGYMILERNFRTREGEIDIIASIGNCLCAVEVKKFPKSWDVYDIVYKVDFKKTRNIKKTLSVYLVNSCINKYDRIRFDVALVTDKTVDYLEDAF